MLIVLSGWDTWIHTSILWWSFLDAWYVECGIWWCWNCKCQLTKLKTTNKIYVCHMGYGLDICGYFILWFDAFCAKTDKKKREKCFVIDSSEFGTQMKRKTENRISFQTRFFCLLFFCYCCCPRHFDDSSFKLVFGQSHNLWLLQST